MDQCDQCAYLVYDDETEQYVCDAVGALDEDDVARGMAGGNGGKCPLFRLYDEYKLVQKQN